jgi:hypothetical protein
VRNVVIANKQRTNRVGHRDLAIGREPDRVEVV